IREELESELQRVRRATKAEMVRYQPPGQALAPPAGRPDGAVRVRITRPPS
ncbi:MAG: hypothetical protein H0U20_05675, partial [Thermoleophilaceae bacterium]|nr:hypothetical protein [Thermoleophilaceae bacterium]